MSHPQERVLLEEDGISVTTASIQATGRQYPGLLIPMASVASVYEFGLGPGVRARKALEAWIFAAYLLALFLNVANIAGDFALLLAALATVAFLASRPASPLWKALNSRRRIVEVRDSSGEVHALKASTFAGGLRMYEAIKLAIADRHAAGA